MAPRRKICKVAKDGKAADATKDAKDLEAAGDQPKADADQTAALDAMFVDAATPGRDHPAGYGRRGRSTARPRRHT
jgi:hypothetical protein